MQRAWRKYVFLFLFFPPGATSSHSALRAFIKIVDSNLFLSRHAPLARIVARLFGGATGCNILRHRARSLEYRCPRFCGFSSAHGTRYFFCGSESLGPFLADTFISVRQPYYLVRNFRWASFAPKSYSATSNLIISIREDGKHRNNLPNV